MHPSFHSNDPKLDMPFDLYTQRQRQEIATERINTKAQIVMKANQFRFENNAWIHNSYEGYGIITMLSDHKQNKTLTEKLVNIQKELRSALDADEKYYFLPAQSFHQTIANNLSNERYQKFIGSQNLENKYPYIVEEVFKSIENKPSEKALAMKMIGLGIFGNALGALGIFENEEDYKRICHFRSSFYNHKKLSDLDVRMTRPFIGHITLMYIESDLNKDEKTHLADSVNTLNQTFGEEDIFYIETASLMRYHHLADFFKNSYFPTYTF